MAHDGWSLAWTMGRRHGAPRRTTAHHGYDDPVNDATSSRRPDDTTGKREAAARPTEPSGSPAGATPGDRRLAHPPSDRYRAAEAQAAAATTSVPDPSASVVRGLALAIAAGLLGAGAIVFVGGVATLTTGLLAIAGLTGLAIAVALVYGAGSHLAGRRRIALAVGLSVGAVALGQLGLWQYGRAEGGVLPLIDYLAQVFGPLVLAEFVAAAFVAAVAAR